MKRRRRSGRVRLLSSPGGTCGIDNIELLVNNLPATIDARDFGWLAGLFGRWDVIHVHWPELLLRHGTALGRVVKPLLLIAIVLRARVTGRAVVWTVHNIRPHEDGSWLERTAYIAFTRLVSARVYMAPSMMPPPGDTVDVYIPLGDYTPAYRPFLEGARPIGQTATTQLLLFGILRPYKGIDELIHVFAGTRDVAPDFRLTIAGRPLSEEYGDTLRLASEPDDRVTFTGRQLSREEIADLTHDCTVVVLPYKEMLNSGVLLLALTLHRPVIVPRSSTMVDLSDEVGEGWVVTYDGDLDVDTLVRAVDQVTAHPPVAPPDLSRRAWADVSARHAELYDRISS